MSPPTPGFGKTVAHNLELLRRLGEIAALALVMVGLSRTSMVGKLVGLPPERRQAPGIALALLAPGARARLWRTVEAIRTPEAVYPPAGA